ncbi:hypothetical protein Tco_0848780 [Tanacetum coccineum]
MLVMTSWTFRVILFSIHSDEWKSFQCHHQTALCEIVIDGFTLTVLSALRHFGIENKQAWSVLMESEVIATIFR